MQNVVDGSSLLPFFRLSDYTLVEGEVEGQRNVRLC